MYDVRAKEKLCIFIHIGSGYCCCYCIVWCCHCVAFVNVSWYFSLSIRERPIATVRICFQDKCDEYWPEPGTTTTYGHVTVTSQDEEERADFVIRTFILKVKAVRTKMELADVLSPGKQSFVYNYKNETIGTDPLAFNSCCITPVHKILFILSKCPLKYMIYGTANAILMTFQISNVCRGRINIFLDFS